MPPQPNIEEVIEALNYTEDYIKGTPYEKYSMNKVLIEIIKKRYPKEINLEGLEPALSSDISELMDKAYTSGFNTAKERAKDIIYNGGVQIDDLITVEDKLHIIVENPKSSQIILLDGEVLEAINNI